MSDWKEEFRKAMINALIADGMPIRDDGGFYGWQDYDKRDEVKQEIMCVGVDYEKTTYIESSWDEFMGTFYEGDTRKTGLDITVVLKSSKKGGRSVKLRYTGTVSDLILAVTR